MRGLDEVTEPWHYTTALDALDHWQALIAGGLGFLAAIIVVYVTLRIERRKLERELDACASRSRSNCGSKWHTR
jgi:hypothetical protein